MVLPQHKQSPAFNPRGTVAYSSGSHVAGMLRRAKPSPSGEDGRAQQRRMRSPQQGRRRWFSPNTSSPPRSTREGLLLIRSTTMSPGCFAAQGRIRSFPLRGFGACWVRYRVPLGFAEPAVSMAAGIPPGNSGFFVGNGEDAGLPRHPCAGGRPLHLARGFTP